MRAWGPPVQCLLLRFCGLLLGGLLALGAAVPPFCVGATSRVVACLPFLEGTLIINLTVADIPAFLFCKCPVWLVQDLSPGQGLRSEGAPRRLLAVRGGVPLHTLLRGSLFFQLCLWVTLSFPRSPALL